MVLALAGFGALALIGVAAFAIRWHSFKPGYVERLDEHERGIHVCAECDQKWNEAGEPLEGLLQ